VTDFLVALFSMVVHALSGYCQPPCQSGHAWTVPVPVPGLRAELTCCTRCPAWAVLDPQKGQEATCEQLPGTALEDESLTTRAILL
jgi:hypothetical protein